MKVTYLGWAKPDDPIYKSGPVVGGIRIGRSMKKGKPVDEGWQDLVFGVPKATDIITGANLKKPKEK
jgi:hypothetical protein